MVLSLGVTVHGHPMLAVSQCTADPHPNPKPTLPPVSGCVAAHTSVTLISLRTVAHIRALWVSGHTDSLLRIGAGVCAHTQPPGVRARTHTNWMLGCVCTSTHVWCLKGQAHAHLWGDKGAGTQCSDTRPLDIGNNHTCSQSVGDRATQDGKDLHPIFPPSF